VGRSRRLRLQLTPDQPRVAPSSREQLRVCPQLRHHSALQHGDAVGALHGREPVRDNQRRALPRQCRALDRTLRHGHTRTRSGAEKLYYYNSIIILL
jgi:hypothetical protein